MNKINEFLQEKRIEQQISIQKLAKSSGVSASHISRIEKGTRNPSPETLEKLSAPLKVDYLTLLEVANLIEKTVEKTIDLEIILLSQKCIFRDIELSKEQKLEILNLLKKEH